MQTQITKKLYLGKREHEFEVAIDASVTEDHTGAFYVNWNSFDIYRNGKELTGKRYDVVADYIDKNEAVNIDEYLIEECN